MMNKFFITRFQQDIKFKGVGGGISQPYQKVSVSTITSSSRMRHKGERRLQKKQGSKGRKEIEIIGKIC
jgi:hypothetical protein